MNDFLYTDPVNTKEVTPIYRVLYFNTPFTGPSDGIDITAYKMTDTDPPDFSGETNLEKIYEAVTGSIGFYSGHGVYPGFHVADNFALKFTGYINLEKHPDGANLSQTFNFKAIGFGHLKVIINNSSYIYGGASTYTNLNPTAYSTNTLTINTNAWYKIEVYYYCLTEEAGFSVLFANENDLHHYVPLDTGYIKRYSTGNSGYLLSKQVEDIISLSVNESDDGTQTLSFTTPFTYSGSGELDGYYYNEFWQRYHHINDSYDFCMDKGRLVYCDIGYRPNTYPTNSDEYVRKFAGHIKTFKISRNPGGKDTLTVECKGLNDLYQNSLNLNFPDKLDYWNAEYGGLDASDKVPDGINYPITFDGWELSRVVKVLSIKAGVDGKLISKHRLFRDYTNDIVSGTHLLYSAYPEPVILDKPLYYGQGAISLKPEEIPDSQISDMEYIHKSNFGDTLFDYLNSITDVYGWKWYTDSYYDGAPVLDSVNNPASLINLSGTLALSDTVYYDCYVCHYRVAKYLEYCPHCGIENTFGPVLASDTIAFYGVNWVKGDVNLDAIYGTYIETNTADEYVDVTFTGRKVAVVCVIGTDSGLERTILKAYNYSSTKIQITVATTIGLSIGDFVVLETVNGEYNDTPVEIVDKLSNWTIHVSKEFDASLIKKGGYLRASTFTFNYCLGTTYSAGSKLLSEDKHYSCYYSNNYDRIIGTGWDENKSLDVDTTKRFYYQGIDPKTGKNPCIFTLIDNIPYDTYTMRVKRIDTGPSTNYLRLDAFMIYDKNSREPVFTYYTGDTSVISGTILSLDVEDSIENLRNDVIVVGRRLGEEVAGSSDQRIINPGNPMFRYIISRATDINSIMNPDVINYIGRPCQTIQIAPEISSQDRANYWATGFIHKYRNPGRIASYEAVGNPSLRIGDCISIIDNGKYSISTKDKLWVTGIESSIGRLKYTNTIKTTTEEPWESYTPKPKIDQDEFSGQPITNLRIRWDGAPGTEYDPYTSAAGKLVSIEYDLLVDAYVSIDIMPRTSRHIIVATLLNPTGSEGTTGWQRQEPGKNYKVTWDGVDAFGDWNKQQTEEQTEPIGKGFFVVGNSTTDPFSISADFYIRFTIRYPQNTGSYILYSTDTSLLGANDLSGTGYITTKLGAISTVQLAVTPDFYDSTQLFYPAHATKLFNVTSKFFNDSNKDIYGNNKGLKITLTPDTDLGGYDREISVDIRVENHVIAGCEPFKKESGYGYCPVTPWSTIIRKNEEFKFYKSAMTIYYNPKDYGYSYNDIKDLGNFKSLRYMFGAWYLKFYLTIRDKSGRKIIPYKNFVQNKYYDTFWHLWIDDVSPYPDTTVGVGKYYEWTIQYPTRKDYEDDWKNRADISTYISLAPESEYNPRSSGYMYSDNNIAKDEKGNELYKVLYGQKRRLMMLNLKEDSLGSSWLE